MSPWHCLQCSIFITTSGRNRSQIHCWGNRSEIRIGSFLHQDHIIMLHYLLELFRQILLWIHLLLNRSQYQCAISHIPFGITKSSSCGCKHKCSRYILKLHMSAHDTTTGHSCIIQALLVLIASLPYLCIQTCTINLHQIPYRFSLIHWSHDLETFLNLLFSHLLYIILHLLFYSIQFC